MSRLNPQRSIGGEDNLARRIERERTKRGWSYEALAKRMTDAGCSIQASAIYKIERSDPPRRITVDELIALARVFRMSIEDLLRPIGVVDKERAHKLLLKLDEADMNLGWAADTVVAIHVELFEVAADDPELVEHVESLRSHRTLLHSREGGAAFYEGLMDEAQQMADSNIRYRRSERVEE